MTVETEKKEKPDKPEHKMVTVTVFALNSTEGKSFTWPKTMKVRDAAAAAAAALRRCAAPPAPAAAGSRRAARPRPTTWPWRAPAPPSP